MRNIFTRHPRTMNETYWEHLISAGCFGVNMLIGGLACLIHAVFPFMFQKTGSNFLFKMMHTYVCRSSQLEDRTQELSNIIQQKNTVCKS